MREFRRRLANKLIYFRAAASVVVVDAVFYFCFFTGENDGWVITRLPLHKGYSKIDGRETANMPPSCVWLRPFSRQVKLSAL